MEKSAAERQCEGKVWLRVKEKEFKKTPEKDRM